MIAVAMTAHEEQFVIDIAGSLTLQQRDLALELLPLAQSGRVARLRVGGIGLIDETEVDRCLLAVSARTVGSMVGSTAYVVKRGSVCTVEVLQEIAKHSRVLNVTSFAQTGETGEHGTHGQKPVGIHLEGQTAECTAQVTRKPSPRAVSLRWAEGHNPLCPGCSPILMTKLGCLSEDAGDDACHGMVCTVRCAMLEQVGGSLQGQVRKVLMDDVGLALQDGRITNQPTHV